MFALHLVYVRKKGRLGKGIHQVFQQLLAPLASGSAY